MRGERGALTDERLSYPPPSTNPGHASRMLGVAGRQPVASRNFVFAMRSERANERQKRVLGASNSCFRADAIHTKYISNRPDHTCVIFSEFEVTHIKVEVTNLPRRNTKETRTFKGLLRVPSWILFAARGSPCPPCLRGERVHDSGSSGSNSVTR